MPERQCNGCKRQVDWGCTAKQFPAEKGEKALTGERISIGSDGKWYRWTNPSSLPLTIDGEQTYACPRQDLKERGRDWHHLFMYYGMYKAGFMPQNGSVMDQSNKAIEMFRIVDAVNAECDEAVQEENKRKAKQEQNLPRNPPQRPRRDQ